MSGLSVDRAGASLASASQNFEFRESATPVCPKSPQDADSRRVKNSENEGVASFGPPPSTRRSTQHAGGARHNGCLS
jgi:hypothetical protein